MRIAVVNLSDDVDDDSLLDAIRAISKQLQYDLPSLWSVDAELALVSSSDVSKDPELLRGDAVLYLCDLPDGEDVGFHRANHLDVPYGYVFTKLAETLDEPWSVALSHEALEMVIDPQLNQFVVGPDPKSPGNTVQYYKEICDAVQKSRYSIGDIEVSNFVSPDFFNLTPPRGRTVFHGNSIAPFTVLPGGYLQYVDGTTGQARRLADSAGSETLRVKNKFMGKLRRVSRHAGAPRRRAAKGKQ